MPIRAPAYETRQETGDARAATGEHAPSLASHPINNPPPLCPTSPGDEKKVLSFFVFAGTCFLPLHTDDETVTESTLKFIYIFPFFITDLGGEATDDVEAELRGATAVEPLVREVPMQAGAHGYALLPEVNDKHGNQQMPLELRPIEKREGEENRQLQKADGVERSAGHVGKVEPLILLVASGGQDFGRRCHRLGMLTLGGHAHHV